MPRGTRATLLTRSATLPLLMAAPLLLFIPPAAADEARGSRGLRRAVTLEGVRQHQAALQGIADGSGGNRLAGTSGSDASAQYVHDRAIAAGYITGFQDFEFLLVSDRTPPVLEQDFPAQQAYADGVDFATMNYSGSGTVTAPVTAVDLIVPGPAPNTSTSGCEASDFTGFPPGHIALLQRGTCTFRLKALNAKAAGAAGVIIFNEGNPGRTGVIFGTLSAPPLDLPVVGATFALGEKLRGGLLHGPTGAQVHLRTDTIAEVRTTRNVIAETPGGDPGRVVVVGAHLDSVSRGPGINDNGSGSGVILEIAEVLSRYDAEDGEIEEDDEGFVFLPRNKLRFIWFGAEEQGLLGSRHYVNQLTQAERDGILAMLNFDMVGSPNFVRFVYDGDNSAFPPGSGGVQTGPPGSGFIEQVFLDYFASQRLSTEPTPFNGRSDYGPFIAANIPAGGLFTGAEGIKTPEQQAIYGGTADIQYDPCYHLACDTFANNSDAALDQMADASAHAILSLSRTREDIRGAAAAALAGAAGAGEATAGEHEGHLLVK